MFLFSLFSFYILIFFFTAIAYGDPHFITFDNVHYGFHGKGDYVLLKSDQRRFLINVQARFEQPSRQSCRFYFFLKKIHSVTWTFFSKNSSWTHQCDRYPRRGHEGERLGHGGDSSAGVAQALALPSADPRQRRAALLWPTLVETPDIQRYWNPNPSQHH